MEDNRRYRKTQEKRLERLITEEKVLTSVINQLKSQFIVLHAEGEELQNALNKLKNEIVTKNKRDEGISIGSGNVGGVAHLSEQMKMLQSSEQLLNPSCFSNNLSGNIGMDFDEVIKSNISSDCFVGNTDTASLGSEFDSLLLSNSEMIAEKEVRK